MTNSNSLLTQFWEYQGKDVISDMLFQKVIFFFSFFFLFLFARVWIDCVGASWLRNAGSLPGKG